MNLDWIVMGLGNPGSRYQFTRHNAGFLALDFLAEELRVEFSATGALAKSMSSEIVACDWDDKKILLIKPQTFMNLSGEALRNLYMKHSHLRAVPLVVLHDEIDLPLANLRIKKGGGDAGHNGLKSLRATLGHGEFYRIRLGVGKPVSGSGQDVADCVLQNFSSGEELKLGQMIEQSIHVLQTLIWQGLDKAQERSGKEF